MLKYIELLIKLLHLGNPTLYYDRDVNDDGDNGSENYDDLVVAGFDLGFFEKIISSNRLRLCHIRQPHRHLRN